MEKHFYRIVSACFFNLNLKPILFSLKQIQITGSNLFFPAWTDLSRQRRSGHHPGFDPRRMEGRSDHVLVSSAAQGKVVSMFFNYCPSNFLSLCLSVLMFFINVLLSFYYSVFLTFHLSVFLSFRLSVFPSLFISFSWELVP